MDGMGGLAAGLSQGLNQGMQAMMMVRSQKMQERQMALQTANSVLQIAKLPKSARTPVIDHFNETLKGTGQEGLHPVVIEALKKAGDDEFADFAKGFASIVSGDKDLDLAATLKGATSFEGGTTLLTNAFTLARQNREQQNMEKAITSLTGGGATTEAAAPVAAAGAPSAAPTTTGPMFTPNQVSTLRALAAAGEGKEALKLAAKFQFDSNERTPINIKMPDGKIEAHLPGTPGLIDAITKRRGIVDRTPQTVVNMENRMETEYGREAGKGIAKIHNERVDAATKADAQLAGLEAMAPLVEAWEAAGGSQGALASLQAQGSSALQSIGIDPTTLGLPADAGPAQAIEALQKRLAIMNIGQGGMPANNFSEADRDFIQGMQGGLADTANGMRAKMFVANKLAARTREAADYVLEGQAEGKNGQEIERGWRQFVRENPIFTPDDKKALAQMTTAKGNSPASILKMTVEELDALDPASLSPAQLRAAAQRYKQIGR
jgi:hypothetical protein